MPEAARYSLGEEDILEEEAIERVRCAMSGRPTNLPSTPVRGSAKAWRRVQVRQLFRLALESLLYWIILEIGKGPKPTEVLVTDFLGQCAALPERRTAAEWLEPSSAASTGPAEFMARIEDSLDDPAYKDFASSIATGLAFCIAEAPEPAGGFRARGSLSPRASPTGGEGLEPSFRAGLRAPRPGVLGSRTACLLERRPGISGCPGARKNHSPVACRSGRWGMEAHFSICASLDPSANAG